MGRLSEGAAIAGAHLTANASSPATVNYAGHVGVGMLMVVTIGDVTGGAWTVTSLTDSAGNTYSLVGGAAGSPYYISGANNAQNPGTPFYVCQFPGIWVYDCVLAHAVDASTVLTVHVSAAADLYLNGNQFVSLAHPASVGAMADNGSPGAGLLPLVHGGLDDLTGIPLSFHVGSPSPNPTGVGLTLTSIREMAEATHWTPPRYSENGGVLVDASNVNTSPDAGAPGYYFTVADIRATYARATAAFNDATTGIYNPWDTSPVYAETVGRGFGFAYDGAEAGPSSTLDSAFTLTGHTVAPDGTLTDGQRLDMTFESHGSWTASAGFTGSCLSGDTTQETPSWFAASPAVLQLASNNVNTPSGPQPWNTIMSWWSTLVSDPALASAGPPALIDMTLFLDTTQAGTLYKPCNASPVTGLAQHFQVFDNNGVPDVTGPLTFGHAVLMTGDLLVDGAVTATGVPLESTVLGHTLGFRMKNHHMLPAFLPEFAVYSAPDGAWNTMTAHVTVKVSLYLRAPYVDPSATPDTWTQPVEAPTGPPLPGTGGTGVGPMMSTAVATGDADTGVVQK